MFDIYSISSQIVLLIILCYLWFAYSLWRVMLSHWYIFDFQSWYLYKSRHKGKLTQVAGGGRISPDITPLREILGIQVINDGPDKTYELNVMLKNGERLNILEHNSLWTMRVEADIIASRLNIQVYDPTKDTP